MLKGVNNSIINFVTNIQIIALIIFIKSKTKFTCFGIGARFLRGESGDEFSHDKAGDGEDRRSRHDYQSQPPTVREGDHKAWGREERKRESMGVVAMITRVNCQL